MHLERKKKSLALACVCFIVRPFEALVCECLCQCVWLRMGALCAKEARLFFGWFSEPSCQSQGWLPRSTSRKSRSVFEFCTEEAAALRSWPLGHPLDQQCSGPRKAHSPSARQHRARAQSPPMPSSFRKLCAAMERSQAVSANVPPNLQLCDL